MTTSVSSVSESDNGFPSEPLDASGRARDTSSTNASAIEVTGRISGPTPNDCASSKTAANEIPRGPSASGSGSSSFGSSSNNRFAAATRAGAEGLCSASHCNRSLAENESEPTDG
jgi:hypothetical protein